MNQNKIYLIVTFALLTGTICKAQINLKNITKDFVAVSGNWHGTLTYLDYSSGKLYTMPANVEINRITKTNKFIFSNIYPDEISANSIDTMTISKDGKYINNELIVSRRKLENGDTEIITEESGKDGNDNKPATFRHTYTLGKTTYKKRKDVLFKGDTEWINRHEYSYTKMLSR